MSDAGEGWEACGRRGREGEDMVCLRLWKMRRVMRRRVGRQKSDGVRSHMRLLIAGADHTRGRRLSFN